MNPLGKNDLIPKQRLDRPSGDLSPTRYQQLVQTTSTQKTKKCEENAALDRLVIDCIATKALGSCYCLDENPIDSVHHPKTAIKPISKYIRMLRNKVLSDSKCLKSFTHYMQIASVEFQGDLLCPRRTNVTSVSDLELLSSSLWGAHSLFYPPWEGLTRQTAASSLTTSSLSKFYVSHSKLKTGFGSKTSSIAAWSLGLHTQSGNDHAQPANARTPGCEKNVRS